jgi:hypothetical protein
MSDTLSSPRLALWLSIVAAATLIIGLSYAIATQMDNSETGGVPTTDVVSALADSSLRTR